MDIEPQSHRLASKYSAATTLEGLPPRVKAAIVECSPSGDIETWIHQQIPALGNRSVVGMLAELGESGELEVIALCRAIRGRS